MPSARRQGYPLNRFCMSLMHEDNRKRFKADEAGYVKHVRNERKSRLRRCSVRSWNRMLELGGNVYFMAKLFFTDGRSVQFACAQMSGMTQDAYATMMLGVVARRTAIATNASRPMADVFAALTTSHVPAMGAAVDLGKTRDEYWRPVFAGYEFAGAGLSRRDPT